MPKINNWHKNILYSAVIANWKASLPENVFFKNSKFNENASVTAKVMDATSSKWLLKMARLLGMKLDEHI